MGQETEPKDDQVPPMVLYAMFGCTRLVVSRLHDLSSLKFYEEAFYGYVHGR